MSKKCPYCAEKIKDAAVKCKHCGSNLVHQNNESQFVSAQGNINSKQIPGTKQGWYAKQLPKSKKYFYFGLISYFLPVIYKLNIMYIVLALPIILVSLVASFILYKMFSDFAEENKRYFDYFAGTFLLLSLIVNIGIIWSEYQLRMNS